MTVAHLGFAAGATLYILVAVRFEERDLVRVHGEDYRRYRERVPMLLPLRRVGFEPQGIAVGPHEGASRGADLPEVSGPFS
jgi:hypothetical protein